RSGNGAVPNQFFGDPIGYVNGNSKSDSSCSGLHRSGGDAYDLTINIHQRSAGIARVDGGIGLDKGHMMVEIRHFAIESADYTWTDRMIKPIRTANNQGPVSGMHLVDI